MKEESKSIESLKKPQNIETIKIAEPKQEEDDIGR